MRLCKTKTNSVYSKEPDIEFLNTVLVVISLVLNAFQPVDRKSIQNGQVNGKSLSGQDWDRKLNFKLIEG